MLRFLNMVLLTRILQCYSNFPKSYIKRAMEENRVAFKETRGIQGPKTLKKKAYYYTIHRPWTQEAKQVNTWKSHRPKVYVEPIKNWSFFLGDRVQVLVGKDKGKQGLVNSIIRERNWVIVEGLNCYFKYIATPGMSIRQLIKIEGPLLVPSQVSLVDPADNQITDVEWRYTEEGEKVRVSVRTGRIIPLSPLSEETRDYKTKATYNEQPKDTIAVDLKLITYVPKIKTFEQEITEEMGIVDPRERPQTYWY